MFKSGLAVLFLLASWFSASCAYELLPAHVAVVYNGKSELSRRMAREYARVRGVPEGNLVSLDCPTTSEISRKEYEDTIRVPLLEAARKQRWWVPSGIASSPLMNRKIFVLVLMADLPMKIRHETPAPLPGKGVNQMQTDRAAVDSELALLAVGGYERKSWQVNPYFNKREDFVGSGLPSFLVCRLDGLTPDTCMRLVAEPANVEKKGLWGWAVVDRGGPYAQGDRWLDDVFERVREAGIPAYLDDWPQTLPEKFPLSRDTALYCGWYAGNANGPFSDPSFRFLGACHRFDIFVDRLLDGYTVAEASWMSMPVLSWQGLVFGDPLYRPYARMKDMDVEPTEEDRYFQGWWASSVQFGDRWKDRSARLMESARKAPFSCLYEALALECLYRKEPARAGELLSSALDGAADARTRARLLLEILMAERARGGNKAFLQRADGIRGLMSSSAFLPALEEWLARVAPPPDPPEK